LAKVDLSLNLLHNTLAITAGFVQKQSLWSFKTTQLLKQSLYSISDPDMRFYLKVIESQLDKIAVIDYLVQTATKNLFICEFKFKKRELGMDVIHDMKEKIKALKVPKGFAPVPVLFHTGGVSFPVETAGYFYRIVDVENFLET